MARRELKSFNTDKNQQITELNTQIRDNSRHIDAIWCEIQEYSDLQEPKDLPNEVKYLPR